MNTSNSYFSKYLQEKERRRQQKWKRQKRLAAGAPATIALKTIPLDVIQTRVVSEMHANVHREQTSQTVRRRRLPLLISLAVHLIAAFIGTLYVIEEAAIDDDAVVAEIIEPKLLQPKRRIPPRAVKPVNQPNSLPPQPLRLQRSITTAATIPTHDSRFTLPPSEGLAFGDAELRGMEINAGAFERRFLTYGRRAEISSVITDITTHRLIDSSIIEKIESSVPQSEVIPDAVDISTVDMRDVIYGPRFLHKVLPEYPDLARRAQKEGVVWLDALIDVDGSAKDIKVLQGIGFGCDTAAIESLKASRFAPARQGKSAVSVRIQIPYRFRLAV